MHNRLIHIIFTGLLLMVSCSLSAQSVKELERQQKQLKQEIEQTNKMLKQTQSSKTATVNKLNLINQNLKTQKKLVANINSEVNALDREMASLTNRKNQLLSEEEQLRQQYAALIRETHYAQLQQSPLLFLLRADSFQQLVRRIRYMMEFASLKQTQVARLKGVQAEIESQNDLLKANRKQKVESQKQLKREQEKLARDERKQQQMLTQLKKKEKDLKADLAKQQKRAAELNKKIDEKVRQQARSTTTLTQEQQLVGDDFAANKGRLPWPVEKGYISGQFGKHQHPVYENVMLDNKGIYIQTTAGTKARAVFKGTVSSTFVLNGTYAVIVQHGAYRTVYANLSSLAVKQGQSVATKQALGTIATENDQDNKTELYFQVYQNTNILNPSSWITKQ